MKKIFKKIAKRKGGAKTVAVTCRAIPGLEPRHKKFRTPMVSEFGPDERVQHGGVVYEPASVDNDGKVLQVRARVKITCKLDWYLDAGTITEAMWQAGCKFTYLHFCAGKVPRVNVMWRERIQNSRMAGDFDAWMNSKSWAQEALERALAELESDEQDVIWDVCGLDLYAGNPARVRSMQTGLRALSVHFGKGFARD
ncbi:MAG: hypothetical protein GC149_20405 [Gammaproteobacteria bacterium]|nr:hypothetical protein [Gammaproteobacteria bacterium]